jgi:hypothetical protein
MVTVRVGTKEPKDFYIHRARLCQFSPFFKKALDKDWSEAKSKLIVLPDDTAETFEIYCDWLYNISPFRESAVRSEDATQRSLEAEAMSVRYYQAYVFGDKVLDRDFTDMIIDIWMAHMRKQEIYATHSLFKIFNLSAKGDPARQLLIDVMLYIGHSGWFNGLYWNDDLNREALSEITKAYIRQKGKLINRQDAPFYKPDMCIYHWHTKTGDPCYKAKKELGWLRD